MHGWDADEKQLGGTCCARGVEGRRLEVVSQVGKEWGCFAQGVARGWIVTSNGKGGWGRGEMGGVMAHGGGEGECKKSGFDY